MKIAIVNNMVPFVWGGAEELAFHLHKNLIAAGQQAEIIRIPFDWEPAAKIPSQMLLVRNLELCNADLVIGLKFPAYMIRHPHKNLWLVHQYRQAYDLYDINQTNISSDDEGNSLRQCIINADKEVFSETKKIYTISKIVTDRLQHYLNIKSSVLTPPLNDPEIFINKGYESYIVATGRINKMKRQHLLIQSLVFTKKPVKLIIAGPPDNQDEATNLYNMVKDLKLADRVKLDLRFLPRQEYADYVNNALAVACLPYNEELGYVAMEAACAEKPLLSTYDSGGILALARPQQTGWVCKPEPRELADALDQIWTSPQQAQQYGHSNKELWNSMGVSWKKTIEALVQ